MTEREARSGWILTAFGVFMVGAVAGFAADRAVAGIGLSAMAASGLLKPSFGGLIRSSGTTRLGRFSVPGDPLLRRIRRLAWLGIIMGALLVASGIFVRGEPVTFTLGGILYWSGASLMYVVAIFFALVVAGRRFEERDDPSDDQLDAASSVLWIAGLATAALGVFFGVGT